MKRLIALLLFLFPFLTNAQQTANFHQQEVNNILKQANDQSLSPSTALTVNSKPQTVNFASGVKQFLEKYTPERTAARASAPTVSATGDTLIVGALGNDTAWITGTYLQKGPIFIINNGVLIIHNATATILGDIDATGSGKLFADSSSLYFPQQYFYQRGIVSTGNTDLRFTDCSFNYGGMSHNMALLDSSKIILTRLHQNDWSTIGTFGKPTFIIDSTNEAGEIIISGAAQVHISHADTLLPWYQMPNGSIVNTAFPNGDTVQHYPFNSSVSGISGIAYNTIIDTCYYVWWGMMPTDGSDVTISNSVIRSIGLWFTHTDTVAVSGLVDNSSYGAFTASLADRNLKINNSSVQTWSLYPMDSSHIDVSGCIVGEIGAGGHSSANVNKIFVDGSGGYFWASGNGLCFAASTAFTSSVRSEQSGFVIIAYCTASNGAVSGIGSSLLIDVQSTSGQPPVALDGSVVWFDNISGPTTAYADSVVHVNGSAWIDKGPSCVNPMDFGNWQMFYQMSGATTWTPITPVITTEVHESELTIWNTHGLPAGNYQLMLTLKDNLGDSVNAVAAITLLPSILGVNENSALADGFRVYPNPAKSVFTVYGLQFTVNTTIEIYNVLGEKIYGCQPQPINYKPQTSFDVSSLTPGIYILRINSNSRTYTQRLVVSH